MKRFAILLVAVMVVLGTVAKAGEVFGLRPGMTMEQVKAAVRGYEEIDSNIPGVRLLGFYPKEQHSTFSAGVAGVADDGGLLKVCMVSDDITYYGGLAAPIDKMMIIVGALKEKYGDFDKDRSITREIALELITNESLVRDMRTRGEDPTVIWSRETSEAPEKMAGFEYIYISIDIDTYSKAKVVLTYEFNGWGALIRRNQSNDKDAL